MFPIDFLGPIQKKKVNSGKVFHVSPPMEGAFFLQSEALCWARIIPTSQWVGTGPQSLLHLVAEEKILRESSTWCSLTKDFYTDP